MFHIGMIGTENSHAYAFSQIMNQGLTAEGGRKWPDMSVVAAYGPDQETAQRLVKEAGVHSVVASPEEMLHQVDAVMITSRKGSQHYNYAMPFIQAGIPVFIDKPFTTDWGEALKLLQEAKSKGVLVYGGSGCKLAYDVAILKNLTARLRKENELITASLNYPADTSSLYDGFYFYASHLTEMILEIFGPQVKGVLAAEKNQSVTALFRYEDLDVSALFTNGAEEHTAVLYGKKRNYLRTIDVELVYEQEVEAFAAMLRTKRMPVSYSSLLLPVRIMSAIMESVESGKEIYL